MLHWVNPFEGDEGYLDLHSMRSVPHRRRRNLTTGATTGGPRHDETLEFAMTNGAPRRSVLPRPPRPAPGRGWFGFEGIVKHDVESGDLVAHRLPKGAYASETVMAREDSSAEDDGYPTTFTSGLVDDRSQCPMLDAADPVAGPIAAITLPKRILSGTHPFRAGGASLAP